MTPSTSSRRSGCTRLQKRVGRAPLTSKPALTKRLDGYRKMELGNVWLLPVCMVWVAYFLEYPLGWLSWTSMLPMCGLLLLGGLYWRAKLRLLQGQNQPLAILLPWARSLQWPFAIASCSTLTMRRTGNGYSKAEASERRKWRQICSVFVKSDRHQVLT